MRETSMVAAPERKAPTTKDVGLLQQLYRDKQLDLRPDFQRQSVWPRPAKAYLIDTILSDRPIPLLFFHHSVDPQTGRLQYAVVDGQQRLRAIFEYLEDGYSLKGERSAKSPTWSGRRYSELSTPDRHRLLGYDLPIVELKNYTEQQIRDVFVRMNRYGVKLNAAELRHAFPEGAFKLFVEELGAWTWWIESRVFSPTQVARMRPTEFAAEITILLLEGAQDKKDSIDIYYEHYQASFDLGNEVRQRLVDYLEWIDAALPDFATSRWRRPVDLYSLLGALDVVTKSGDIPLDDIDIDIAREGLARLEQQLAGKNVPRGTPARYALAASRQTDNVRPRQTRIGVLADLLRGN
jgi:hypothetical protein